MLYCRPICYIATVDRGKLSADSYAYITQHEKAPPIDLFAAEDIGITFDDWLPILEQAAI